MEIVAYRIFTPDGIIVTSDGGEYEHAKYLGYPVEWLGVVGGIPQPSAPYDYDPAASKDHGEAVAQPAPAVADVCQWQEDEDGHYDTSCGNRYSFIEGGPDDNGQKFCPYCGKRSEQLWYNDMPEAAHSPAQEKPE